jgi:hypothetical protein
MRLVSASKYVDLQYRYQRASEAREAAEKLAAERLSTITRQAEEITRLRDTMPDSPVQYPRPAEGDAELRRQLHLARRAMASMTQQLDDLQRANEGLTAELQDVRQGVAS